MCYEYDNVYFTSTNPLLIFYLTSTFLLQDRLIQLWVRLIQIRVRLIQVQVRLIQVQVRLIQDM